ncbi:unnamed protein product [Malus baccata var. baccata]
MLILHRMAMATSSSFLSIPLLKTSSLLSPVKHCASPLSSEFRALSLYGGRNEGSISSAMATEAQISTQDDKLKDAQMEVADKPEKVVLPTNESSESLIKIRHTFGINGAFSAVMVMNYLYVFDCSVHTWIENGFYYDFDMEPLTDKELKRIKKEMDRIIGRNLPLIREEVSRDEAHKKITALNQPYKLEILDSIKEDPITIYHIGDEWWDLCAGPHVEKTGNINRKVVELESIAGAYRRGDEKKPMLQRIYGTAWETKHRDHRHLGQVLDLFSIQICGKKIHIERGYDLLYTPHVAKANLWQISGHLDYYKENMYDQMNVEDELYQLRPMNCPYHILVYKRKPQSYHEFPIRVAELGAVYRYELSGSLHGLFRVRGFTQDDAHVFCLEDQIKDEIRSVLDLTEELLLQFGFSKCEVNLSTTTSALRDALDDKGWSYQIDEGGGAFYGPKINLKVVVVPLKVVSLSISVDFNLPQRFDLTYADSNSEKKRPIMIHRAVLGSLKRFFGVLREHYAGDFPLWLSPVQAHVLPVTDSHFSRIGCLVISNRLALSGKEIKQLNFKIWIYGLYFVF